MKKQMIALTPFRYGTRHLVAGDGFEATPGIAKALIAVKKAKVRGTVPPPSEAVKTKIAKGHDELTAAREEYQAKVGKRPFFGWAVAELRRRIAEADQPETEQSAETEAADAAS